MIKMKGLLTIGFSDIVGTGISAIFWFFLASQIEPEEYGEIFYFLGIVGIASYISLIGTQDTITVYSAKNVKIQSTFYLLSLIAGGISSIVIIMIFFRVDVGLILFGFIITTLTIGDLLGRKLYGSYSKYILMQKSLTLILGLGFYYLFGFQGVLYGLALSYSAYAIRIYKGFKEFKIDFSLLKPRFGFIINNYVRVLAHGSRTQIDKLIIAPLLGFSLLGNYALSLQMVGVMLIFTTIVFKYTLPQDATGNPNKKLKKLILLLSIGIAIVGFLFSPIIIQELFPKYNEAIDAIQIMSLSVVPATVSMIYTSKFLGLEKSKFVLISKIISLFTIISGTVILGSIFGMIGLAIAFVLSISVEAMILVLINLKSK